MKHTTPQAFIALKLSCLNKDYVYVYVTGVGTVAKK